MIISNIYSEKKETFKIGKSPSTVHSIIKKREKRDKFLNQPVVEGYKNFDILFYKVSED